jgi:hypothetical protein
MEPLSISVILFPDGRVEGRRWPGDAVQPVPGRVDLSGLDGRVLRVFQRWLMDYERKWDREDIRVFGQLLHRRLFPPQLWRWVQDQIDQRGGEIAHLQLAFPADAASSRLAALPWEFLCAPSQPGNDDRFLVLMPGVMLSRTVPSGWSERTALAMEDVRVLPVVGDADKDYLGLVDYEPALDAIAALNDRPDFTILDPVVQATEKQLAAAVAEQQPHLVHYIGHGRFDERSGTGALALRAEDGDTEWIEEERLADRICTTGWKPRIVVLHACEGGRNEYDFRHAGLAPTLVRRGVQCVVAMQYPVTNQTANEFSAGLYDALAQHQDLDQAVQSARQRIWTQTQDARLLGVPMVYQRDATPLLGAPATEGGSE